MQSPSSQTEQHSEHGATAREDSQPSAGLEASQDTEEAIEQNDKSEAGEISDNEDDDGSIAKYDKSSPSRKSATNVANDNAPPLPQEAVPAGPPLPNEAVPEQQDDGWDYQWDPTSQAWFFYNRFTGKSQWDNPRITTAASSGPQPPPSESPGVGGYNPAIHGDYDPNAWYAKGSNADETDDLVDTSAAAAAAAAAVLADAGTNPYSAVATFNRFTGAFQTGDTGPGHHSDEAKSKRQMSAYFDVEAAANSHDGRSLRAERSSKKPSKAEVKAFKEKRRARKEEKRRAWLMD